MIEYCQGLLEIRAAYSIFRSNGSDVTITFGTLAGGGMTAHFTDAQGNEALVLINPIAASVDHSLEGEWTMLSDGVTAGAESMGTISGTVKVDSRSVVILVK